MPISDLQKALDAIRAKLPDCQRYVDYYDGRHPLTFASDKFETTFGQRLKRMRDNLCPIVVDAHVDRMEVLNFGSDDDKANKAIAEAAWEIWQRDTLELTSSDVHREALKCGVGYLIVWADENNRPRFYAQDSRQCVVLEDDDTGTPLFGAKQWLTDEKFVRVTLYYANRVEKYISQKKYDGTHHQELKDAHFSPVKGEEAAVANPWNVLPMFRFKAMPILSDVMPIQDALNKTIADKLVTMEFAAFPQRWAVGITPPKNEITGIAEAPFKHGQDQLWVATDTAVKFGEFTAAALEQFLKVADSYRLEMARVSGTPLHFFSINTSDAISGEALKTLESRFTKKVKRLTLNFGVTWADVMRFALMIEGKSGATDNLTTQWASPEQRSEKEFLESQLLKRELGVPDEVLLEEYGYTKEDIAKFDLDKEPEESDDAMEKAKAMAALVK